MAAALAPQPAQPQYGTRYAAWQRTQTDRTRDQLCAAIVEGMDADMCLRLIRAALPDLSGYALGHDKIIDGIDLIQSDIDEEDARQMGERA